MPGTKRKIALFALWSALLIPQFHAAAQTINIVTQHNDNSRTGANLLETTLTTANVNSTLFGKVFSRAVNGQIYAQPLYLTGVVIPNKGTHNVVYVATEHNCVYAFDADDPSDSGTLLWLASSEAGDNPVTLLPTPFPSSASGSGDLSPEIGITGTPVIDPPGSGTATAGTIFFVTKNTDGDPNNPQYYNKLWALDVATGVKKSPSPVIIAGANVQTYVAQKHLNRPGLLLLNGVVYIGFGSHGDSNPYQGWVFGYNAATLAQTAAWCSAQRSATSMDGIWQSGNGLAADGSGNIYLMTGNGSFNVPPAGSPQDYGESFVKLSTPTLTVSSYFTPSNVDALNGGDVDLGSGGPLVIPGTTMICGDGKEGVLYLLNQSNLGGFTAGGPDAIVQRVDGATSFDHCNGPNPVYWNGPSGALVYLWPGSNILRAYKLVNGQFVTTPQATNAATQALRNGGLSISANGGTSGSGILWGVSSNDSAVYAFDASNVAAQLWNSGQNASDSLGTMNRFVPPTIANGRVYVASSSGQLAIYGLFSAVPPALASVTTASATSVTVKYNKVVTATASNKANYAISDGTNAITINSATLAADNKTVTLSVGTLATSIVYTLTVNNITDNDGHTIQPGSHKIFSLPAPPGNGTGLYAEYFSNNTGLTAPPSQTRVDASVDFHSDGNATTSFPGGYLINYSIRWTGLVQPRYTETYTFITGSDDGVRVYVNGQQLINNWTGHGLTYDSGKILLLAGVKYDFRMENYNGGGPGDAHLYWSSASQAQEIIPALQLYPSPGAPTISPNGGIFSNPVNVTLSANNGTSGVVLRYTQNGSDPDANSTQYMAAFPVSGNVTVKARASLAGYSDSAVATAVFGNPVVPTHLHFTVQPTNTATTIRDANNAIVTQVISPAVQVAILDDSNMTITSATTPITLSIGQNPGGGTLLGTVTVTPVNGVAAFSNLSIHKTGNGYTLAASASGLAGETSNPFNILPGVATQVGYVVQPSNTLAATAISPPVQIAVRDSYGNTATTANNVIAITLFANPSGGVLSGTTSLAASGGVAVFDNLFIDKGGNGYSLKAANAGLTGSISTAFNVAANDTAAAPIINPNGGSFSGPVTVRLTTATSGATIKYTTDTSDPASSGTAQTYNPSQPFQISATATLKAVAILNGLNNSPPSQAFFTITGNTPYGLPYRDVVTTLNVPATLATNPPALLSQTGVFSSLATLTPNAGIVPYHVNTPLWSDGAVKTRWIALPGSAQISFQATGEWTFPSGTVLIKHFDLGIDDTNAALHKRLETRLLVVDNTGANGYGITYKWRADNSDADLLPGSLSEVVNIATAGGGTRQQTWYYPSRGDCLSCHTTAAHFLLGVKTRQLNGDFQYPSSGITDNQLRTFNYLQMLNPALNEANIPGYSKLFAVTDAAASLEDRARSYIDANCAQCHRPGGSATHANFDARWDTPLASQGIINGAVVNTMGIDNAKVVVPKDEWRSILHNRIDTVDNFIKMPPLARNTIDEDAEAEITAWINSLPGTPALPPPSINPPSGSYSSLVNVTFTDDDPAAAIHYTLDGSLPDAGSPVFSGSLTVTASAIVMANAFRNGFNNSAATKATYTISAGAATSVVLSGLPANSTAGAAQTVTVTAMDSGGHVAAGFTGTVHFTKTDPIATVPPDYTFVAADNGAHTFNAAVILKTAGSQTLMVATAGLTSSQTSNVSAGAPAQLAFSAQPADSIAGGGFAVAVSFTDAFGNPIANATNSVSLAIGVNPGGGTLMGTTTVNAFDGFAIFNGLSIVKAGIGYTLAASSNGLTGAESSAFEIFAGDPDQLAFIVQPSDAPAGAAISPAVKVEVKDFFGNLFPYDFGPNVVIVAIGFNPSGGTLAGTKTAAVVNGVAVFSDLSIDKLGTGYTLTATAANVTSATSGAFNITLGAPAKLQFIAQPGDTVAGEHISSSVEVAVLDAGGNRIGAATDSITLSIGVNPGNGTLSGTVTVPAVNGVATFGDLSIDKTGVGYTLSASAGGLSGTGSSAFNITPAAPARLDFIVQPANSFVGAVISPPVKVAVEDAFGNQTPNAADSVTIAIGVNPANGALAGTATYTVTAGVAAFSDLSIDKAGTGYTLSASASGLTGAVSIPFDISSSVASRLAFTVQPADALLGAAIYPAVKVSIEDADGNVFNTTGVNVTVALGANAAGGTLSGTATVITINGVATFSGLSIDKVGTGYTLAASADGLAGAISVAFAVNTTVDSDSDGFSDEIEIGAGSDPHKATSTPLDAHVAGAPLQLPVKKTQISLSTKPHTDKISLSGSLPLAVVPPLNGMKVVLDFGGVVKTFTLNDKGASTPPGNESFKLSTKPRNGVAAFQLNLKKGSYAATLSDEDLTLDHTIKPKQPRTVMATVLFNDNLYQVSKTIMYTATARVRGSGN